MAETKVIAAPRKSPTSVRAGLAWIEPTIALDHGGPLVPYERPDEDFTGGSIYDLFERAAARYETAAAVCDGVGRLTYAQIRSAARALAGAVRARVPAGKAVAVVLPNGAESLIAVLACLAAHRTCIVLNAADPAERKMTILRRAAVGAVIVKDDTDASALVPADVVRIRAVRESGHPVDDPVRAPAPPSDDEPAIVLYTSGSTGEPKGIVLSQAAMLWRVRNAIVSCHFNRTDCLLSLSALVTTGGLVGSLSALLSGCRQFMVSVSADGVGNLLALIRQERVTILWSVPALQRLLFELDSGDAFVNLRLVRTFGESLPWADLTKWRAILPADCHVYITYGQTEGYASGWCVPPDRAGGTGAVPIGYLLPQQQYAIIDEAGNAVAPGEIGELIIRSRYVALGEWEDGQCEPGRARPDVADPGHRVLSTGDLARLDGDGVLHFVGRRDRQVKIHGQRVEPAEIENVLLRVPGVTAAAIAVRRDGEETSLLAFIVAREAGDGRLLERVRATVRQALPSYMQPARILPIERLPLLSGGKVDQTALLALAAATPRQRGEAAVGAGSRARRAVESAWLRVLDRASLDADLPFDEAGGDSLRLLRFIFHLEQQSGIALPLDAFYADLRPSVFAQRLEQQWGDRPPREMNAGLTLFLLPGVGKDEPRLARFRAACAPLRMIPIDYGDWPEWIAPGFDLAAIIARIVAAIEAEAPDGPILLAGYSLGGKIAYAVAIALASAGRTIGFLGILDTDISSDEASPGMWQRFMAEARRGRGAERFAASASRFLTQLPWASPLRLAGLLCRARLPGDFGFYLHWHLRRHVLARLVRRGWARMASPLPQLRGPAILFRSAEHERHAADDLGWRRICPEVTTVAVAGGHGTMFDAPNLAALCAHFKAALLEAAGA